MRTAFVIVALTVPTFALALPDDAILSRVLVGRIRRARRLSSIRRFIGQVTSSV
jgi:hypothetical protein